MSANGEGKCKWPGVRWRSGEDTAARRGGGHGQDVTKALHGRRTMTVVLPFSKSSVIFVVGAKPHVRERTCDLERNVGAQKCRHGGRKAKTWQARNNTGASVRAAGSDGKRDGGRSYCAARGRRKSVRPQTTAVWCRRRW